MSLTLVLCEERELHYNVGSKSGERKTAAFAEPGDNYGLPKTRGNSVIRPRLFIDC